MGVACSEACLDGVAEGTGEAHELHIEAEGVLGGVGGLIAHLYGEVLGAIGAGGGVLVLVIVAPEDSSRGLHLCGVAHVAERVAGLVLEYLAEVGNVLAVAAQQHIVCLAELEVARIGRHAAYDGGAHLVGVGAVNAAVGVEPYGRHGEAHLVVAASGAARLVGPRVGLGHAVLPLPVEVGLKLEAVPGYLHAEDGHLGFVLIAED